MTFVSVLFLLGAMGVAGPIVVHLLARPRFKRLPFTMLQFLREGQSESQARRRLRDWIILLLRCAIITLIALVFARPVWETQVPPPATHEIWFVGLDNSLSMTYRSQGSDGFTRLKAQAKDALRDCSDEAEFHVFLAGGRQWHRQVTKAQAMALVHEMKPAASPAQFGDFLDTVQRQGRRAGRSTRLNVLLGSDFSLDVMMGLRGLVSRAHVDRLEVLCVMPDPGLTNVGIASASVSSVDSGEVQIHVTVRNTGARDATRSLIVKGASVEPEEVTLLAGTHQVCVMNCPMSKTGGGATNLVVSLDGSDDFKADDEIELKVTLPDQTLRRVLLVDRGATDRLFLFKTAIESLVDQPMGVAWETRCVAIDQMTEADLTWADTLVLGGMTQTLSPWIDSFRRHVVQGKRLVCFMSDRPGSAILSDLNQNRLWPVADLVHVAAPTHPESQPMHSEWTHTRAGESLMQYALDRMVLRETSRVRLMPEARCVWRLQNDAPFVVAQPLGKGVTLWVNTSVDASLSPLPKSPAAVAWAQFLLESGAGSTQADAHAPWRDCEPLLTRPPFESVEKVVRTLFQEDRLGVALAHAAVHVTKRSPLWRPLAWCLLILILVEPFVAERMKP